MNGYICDKNQYLFQEELLLIASYCTITNYNRKLSESKWEKSAITDHQNIEAIKLTERVASIVEGEQDWKMRKTKEAIHIRLQGAAVNRH